LLRLVLLEIFQALFCLLELVTSTRLMYFLVVNGFQFYGYLNCELVLVCWTTQRTLMQLGLLKVTVSEENLFQISALMCLDLSSLLRLSLLHEKPFSS